MQRLLFLAALEITLFYCSECQYLKFKNVFETTTKPLPFPTCRADNIDCLRKGIRTFFFMMDAGNLGMTPVDPTILNSVALHEHNEQMSFLLRRVNVTGARWTKLAERRFNVMGVKSGVRFINDLHITAEIILNMASRIDPYVAEITMDLQDVESNITYTWSGHRDIDNEDYITIGRERIAVRNTRTPSFFIQPNTEDTETIREVLSLKSSLLDHLSIEITTAIMHTIVDNFREFASKIPVKYYYQYF